MRNIRIWLGLATLVVLLDQGSKWVALSTIEPGEALYVAPFFNWVLAFNKGASFSFLSDAGGWQRWLFSGLAIAVSIWIIAELRKCYMHRCLSLGFSLILGGALGNVIDRIYMGAVVDFIQVHVAGYYWPAFNVADSAITFGAVLVIWDQLFIKKQPEK